MTKKEQAAMDELRREVALLKAMRFTPKVDPDIARPGPGDAMTRGWLYWIYHNEVRAEKACSTSTSHASGSWDRTTTQGSRSLYSTELLALQAARYELAMDCASALAKVDRMIEELCA